MVTGIGARMIRRLLVTAAIVTLAGLAGCGGGGSSSSTAQASIEGLGAKELLAAVQKAVASATSVHVTGRLDSDGQVIKLDLFMDGRGGRGTVDQNGTTAEMLLLGDDLYLKGDRAVLESVLGSDAPDALAAVGDRYLKGPATDPQVASFTALLKMRDFLRNVLSVEGTLTRVGRREVDGAPAIGLNDDDVENGGTLYVATEGPPYPVLLESNPGSADTGSLRFDRWDSPVTLPVPPAGDVIDVATLAKG